MACKPVPQGCIHPLPLLSVFTRERDCLPLSSWQVNGEHKGVLGKRKERWGNVESNDLG